MFPLTFSQIAKILSQNSENQTIILGASFDSRKIKPGDLFFALRGEKFDGVTFLEEVAKKGAVGAIVPKEYNGDDFDLALLKVDDVVGALQTLAKHFLMLHEPKIVAITGSIGKTTTKEFTHTLLKERFKIGSTPGNANSRVGMPLSIINMKGDEEVLVIEMGMSEAHEIKALIEIAPPDIAVIANIALVHACFFESLEKIAEAKAEIFSHSKSCIRIMNQDMPCLEIVEKVGSGPKVFYSMHNQSSDFSAQKEENSVSIHSKGKLCANVPWNILGDHNIHNYLAAVAVAKEMGMDFEEIMRASKHLKLPPKRMERVERGGVVFINDAYNATEKSMAAALISLPKAKEGGKKIAVLGDMKELGKFAYEMHKNVAELALKHVDTLLCIGDDCKVMNEIWQSANRETHFFKTKEALVSHLKLIISSGDVVLVKGSRSHQLDLIIDEL